jgi:DNA-binding Lrp family transcriptional regulator
MGALPDHLLRPLVSEILEQAKPKEEIPNLELLLSNVLFYLKLVEEGKLPIDLATFPSPVSFNFRSITPSKWLANRLSERLRIIRDYDIHSISRIEEILLYGLTRTLQKGFSQRQIALLELLCKNPEQNPSQLAKHLRISRPTVVKELNQLKEDFGFRHVYLPNGGCLKLTTFHLIFRTKSYEASEKLEQWIRTTNQPFFKSIVFDVNIRNGQLSYAIPAQQRALRLFEQKTEWIRETFMDQLHCHKDTTLFSNIQFDDYHPEKNEWIIPSDLHQYSKINWLKQKPNATFQIKTDLQTPIHFDRIDYILALSNQRGANTIKEKQKLLAAFGYEYSRNPVWQRFRQLKKQGVIFPSIYFSGGGFVEFICLSFLCDSTTQQLLIKLAGRLPFTFTYLTNQGIIIFLKRPSGWGDIISMLIRDLSNLPQIQDLLVVYQERNVGSGYNIDLVHRWNEKRQYWEFKDSEI